MVSFYLQPRPREQQSLSCIDLGWPGAWSPSIFNRGPGSNRASVALTWVDLFWAHLGAICWAHLGAMWGMVLFYRQPAPGPTEPQLHWPGLALLLGPSWRHAGAWSSIFNPGPGSNRASVALTWVDPPSGPILAPYGGIISFYLQPRPREQQSLSCIDLG